jgi:excisionase family DNA binding protein
MELTEQTLRTIIREEIENYINSGAPVSQEYYTRKELSDLIGVSVNTLSRWDITGKLRSTHLGSRCRYSKPVVEQFIRKGVDKGMWYKSYHHNN